MSLIESYAWGILTGSLVTLAMMGVAVAVAVIWARQVFKKALWL